MTTTAHPGTERARHGTGDGDGPATRQRGRPGGRWRAASRGSSWRQHRLVFGVLLAAAVAGAVFCAVLRGRMAGFIDAHHIAGCSRDLPRPALRRRPGGGHRVPRRLPARPSSSPSGAGAAARTDRPVPRRPADRPRAGGRHPPARTDPVGRPAALARGEDRAARAGRRSPPPRRSRRSSAGSGRSAATRSPALLVLEPSASRRSARFPSRYSLLVLAVGMLAGLLLRRTVLSMGVTLAAMLACSLRFRLLRPYLLPAVTANSRSGGPPPRCRTTPGGWPRGATPAPAPGCRRTHATATARRTRPACAEHDVVGQLRRAAPRVAPLAAGVDRGRHRAGADGGADRDRVLGDAAPPRLIRGPARAGACRRAHEPARQTGAPPAKAGESRKTPGE